MTFLIDLGTVYRRLEHVEKVLPDNQEITVVLRRKWDIQTQPDTLEGDLR